MITATRRNILLVSILVILVMLIAITTFPRNLFACGVQPVVVEEEETPKPRVYEKSESGFTELMYNKLLGREPVDIEIELWSSLLSSNKVSASEMMKSFILGKEAQNVFPELSDQEFVDHLYGKLLNRKSDTDGYNNWILFLNSGGNREDVIKGFAESEEFENLYTNFGVIP